MGSGFRVWTAGVVVSASNVNNYLQEQAVMSFAGTATRSSAVASPEEGMLSYLQDTDTYQGYDGSAWVNLGTLSGNTSDSGLILINTTSFSAVASQSVNDVFSATYVRYLILANFSGSATGQTGFRLRVSGSDATASDYAFTNIRSNTSSDTVTGNDRSSSTVYYAPANITADYRAPFELWVTNPFIAENTFFKSFYTQINGTHAYQGITAGNHKLNTSYTGFTIFPPSGNITGSISVFGVNE